MQFAHIGISVADLQTSINWYSKWFNFKVVKEFVKAELEIRGALISNDNFAIELLQPSILVNNNEEASNLPSALRNRGNNHFSVAVNNITKLYAELKADQVKIVSELLENRLFFCYDPDNSLIEVKTL